MKADLMLTFHGQDFRISAKNYSLANSSNIHLVDELPLYTGLARNISHDALMHAANLITTIGAPESFINQAHFLVKTILALEALSGSG